MLIEDFYRQAREWQKDQEHLEREREVKKLAELEEIWGKAKAEIKKLFPFEGAKLYETEPHETDEYPHTGGNYQFDLVLPGVDFTPGTSDEYAMKGVIRVVLNCFVTYSFKPVCFYVWADGRSQRFENPFEAFLAACTGIGYTAPNDKVE